MPDCAECRWLETFTRRPDEPSQHGCKAPVDGGVYVIDTSKPSCAYGGSRAFSFSPRLETVS